MSFQRLSERVEGKSRPTVCVCVCVDNHNRVPVLSTSAGLTVLWCAFVVRNQFQAFPDSVWAKPLRCFAAGPVCTSGSVNNRCFEWMPLFICRLSLTCSNLQLQQLPGVGIVALPPIGKWSVSMSVCVCVFVCQQSYHRKYMSDLHQIFCACYLCLEFFDAVGWAAGRASGL